MEESKFLFIHIHDNIALIGKEGGDCFAVTAANMHDQASLDVGIFIDFRDLVRSEGEYCDRKDA